MTFKRPISIYRQRVLEALVFFAEKRKIRNPSKMMMYKLLAEFDFRHFQETGIPVTNLRYEAFPWGPVPQPLHDEITQDNKLVLPEDFIDALTVQDTFFEDEKGGKHFGFKFIAKRKSNNRIFSPRQQNILQDVALIFKEATATEASMASHEPNKPWTITVARHGLKSTIDLVETLEVQKPLTKEVAAEMLRERNAILHNYGE